MNYQTYYRDLKSYYILFVVIVQLCCDIDCKTRKKYQKDHRAIITSRTVTEGLEVLLENN